MAEAEGLDRDLMVEVWRLASQIVANRPWLLVSWVDDTANIPHVVVHYGPLGAALHFDDDSGPYWSGGFTRRLTWEQASSRSEPDEWETAWRAIGPENEPTTRADVYALISAIHGRWLFDDHEWDARPAPILGNAQIVDLRETFPTAAADVDGYLDEISARFEQSETTGRVEYWHEPFWMVFRDGEPRLLLDESGRLHLPIAIDNEGTRIQAPPGVGIQELVARGDAAAGLASRGYSIDLRTAISRAGGMHELADLVHRGVAAVVFSMELHSAAERRPAADDGTLPATHTRSHWGWEYEGRDYTLAWLDRAKDPEALATWHAREAGRRRRIAALREFSDVNAPALDIEGRADDPEFPIRLADSALDAAVTRHLERHLLPPVPRSMTPACVKALVLVGEGDADALVALPEDVSYADQMGSPTAAMAPAAEVVRQHSLSGFLRTADDAEHAWDLSRALRAWDEAERGEWEIPSPAPTWPEYVTLLLVGRNHLVPGTEDDPSERDMIRSWWIDEIGDWNRAHVELWWTDETTDVMNLPDPDPVIGGDMTLTFQGVDPLERRWMDITADLVAAGRGQSAAASWSEPIEGILDSVRSAGTFGTHDLGELERAFVAESQGLVTTVTVMEAVDADFADFADALSSSIASVGMGFGWSLPESLHIEYAFVDMDSGYGDLSVAYAEAEPHNTHSREEGGEARLELFRAGSRVIMVLTEEVRADQTAASSGEGSRWLPPGSRAGMRSERWAEALSGMHQWYFRMATALREPRALEPPAREPRSDDYLLPVRRDVNRALAYARVGRFADAEIVLESTFDGWVEATLELVEAKLSSEAELAQLTGRERDASRSYRDLLSLLGGAADPGRLIEVTLRALAVASDGQERNALLGFALRVIAFTRTWHRDVPGWLREIERLRDMDFLSAEKVKPPIWVESTLTPPWDGTLGSPALVIIVGSQLSPASLAPGRAHSALARLERVVGDDIVLLSGGSDRLLRLAGSRRIVQLGRSDSPRQLDRVAPEVRQALRGCRQVVLIGVEDIDGWRAAHHVFAPKSQLQVIAGSLALEVEADVVGWVETELSAIAYAQAMQEEQARRSSRGDS